MNIKHMHPIAEYYHKIGVNAYNGISESDIKKVEKEHDVKFPRAYKEFLFLTGKGFTPLGEFDTTIELTLKYMPNMPQWLSKTSIKIEKPYWLFTLEGGKFYFFHLNDGDDPMIHYADLDLCQNPKDNDEVTPIKPMSEWIAYKISQYELYSKFR